MDNAITQSALGAFDRVNSGFGMTLDAIREQATRVEQNREKAKEFSQKIKLIEYQKDQELDTWNKTVKPYKDQELQLAKEKLELDREQNIENNELKWQIANLTALTKEQKTALEATKAEAAAALKDLTVQSNNLKDATSLGESAFKLVYDNAKDAVETGILPVLHFSVDSSSPIPFIRIEDPATKQVKTFNYSDYIKYNVDVPKYQSAGQAVKKFEQFEASNTYKDWQIRYNGKIVERDEIKNKISIAKQLNHPDHQSAIDWLSKAVIENPSDLGAVSVAAKTATLNLSNILADLKENLGDTNLNLANGETLDNMTFQQVLSLADKIPTDWGDDASYYTSVLTDGDDVTTAVFKTKKEELAKKIKDFETSVLSLVAQSGETFDMEKLRKTKINLLGFDNSNDVLSIFKNNTTSSVQNPETPPRTPSSTIFDTNTFRYNLNN